MTTLASVIGMAAGGVISQAFGVVLAYVFAGSILVLVGAIVYISRKHLEGRSSYAESHTGTHRKAQI